MNEENIKPEAQKKMKGKLVIILGVGVAILLAVVIYLFWQYQTLTQNPNTVNREQIERVVQRVDRLIDLPQNELPTLATITDLSRLGDQPFFTNAQVGDQVLLYTTSARAYLYSPGRDIIVEVATLNLGE